MTAADQPIIRSEPTLTRLTEAAVVADLLSSAGKADLSAVSCACARVPCTTLIQCDGPSPYLPSSPSRPYQALGETKRPQEERELRDSSESGVVAASGSGSIGSHTSHTVRASACANVFLLYSDCRAASSRGAPSISPERYRTVDGPIGGTVSGLALPPTPVRVTVAAPPQCVAARSEFRCT